MFSHLNVMKIIYKDPKNKIVKLKITSLEDLWDLNQILSIGDLVSTKTMRKIKIGGEDNSKNVKKPVYLKIEVKKIEFHESSNALRVAGVVVEGSEDVSHGSHHTFNLVLDSVFKIEKQKWLKYQLNKLNEAAINKKTNILICVLDRENATVALLKQYGYDIIAEIEGDVKKKGDQKEDFGGEKFYHEVGKVLEDSVKRYDIEKVIVGSPAFWKDNLVSYFKKNFNFLIDKIVLASCNDIGSAGINEVIKRPEMKTVLAEKETAKEIKLVEDLLKEISLDRNVAYGFEEVKKTVEAGAVKILLVLDSYIQKLRVENDFDKLEDIMNLVDKFKGEVVIISEKNDAGKKLKGLGNIAAILRFKVNY